MIELMIVVVIIGILAATAIPAFQRQIYRARAAEAPGMIGQIRMAEESYRSEFAQYSGPTAFGALYPTASVTAGPVGWTPASAPAELRFMGITPDGPVRFRYRVSSGYGAAPATQFPAGYDDWWYIIQAYGDMDMDGTSYLVEGMSARAQLYISNSAGFE